VNPDIIQTHNNKSHLLLRLLPESRARRLWFAFHHGDTYPDFKQRVYNHVDRVTLQAADRVVTVCQAFRPRLLACGVSPDRVRILHNAASPAPPVSEAERAQLRERLGVRCGEAVILSIGRLSREKGHADLLGALGQLRSLEREWKLVLVGAGPDRDALEELARARCIAARVRFAGFHTEVSPFYAIADVFVLPSHSEGSSNVLLEAMMGGVPIVATTAGGNPEIVLDGQTGLLAGVGDLPGLAAAIRRLLQQQELAARLVAAATARARREFSQDRYRRQLLGFYAEALGRAGAAAEYRSPVGARP
jgi:glycosyltransferase involved in cell wall biosynthesis